MNAMDINGAPKKNKKQKRQKKHAAKAKSFADNQILDLYENSSDNNTFSALYPSGEMDFKEMDMLPSGQEVAPRTNDTTADCSQVLKVLKEMEDRQKTRDRNISKLINRLTEEIVSLRAEVRSIRPADPDHDPLKEGPMLPIFPLNTVEQLEDFEDKLQRSEPTRDALKHSFSNLGADDLAYFIRRAIKKVITDELAAFYTWRGSSDKRSVQYFTLIKIITEQSLEKFPTTDEKRVITIMQQHFLHAKDRLKKRKAKNSNSVLV